MSAFFEVLCPSWSSSQLNVEHLSTFTLLWPQVSVGTHRVRIWTQRTFRPRFFFLHRENLQLAADWRLHGNSVVVTRGRLPRHSVSGESGVAIVYNSGQHLHCIYLQSETEFLTLSLLSGFKSVCFFCLFTALLGHKRKKVMLFNLWPQC